MGKIDFLNVVNFLSVVGLDRLMYNKDEVMKLIKNQKFETIKYLMEESKTEDDLLLNGLTTFEVVLNRADYNVSLPRKADSLVDLLDKTIDLYLLDDLLLESGMGNSKNKNSIIFNELDEIFNNKKPPQYWNKSELDKFDMMRKNNRFFAYINASEHKNLMITFEDYAKALVGLVEKHKSFFGEEKFDTFNKAYKNHFIDKNFS